MTSIAYVANSNMLELKGLKSEAEDSFITNATVTVTVVAKDGTPVDGGMWPQQMNYVIDSEGDYRAILSENLELENKASYTAFIDADAGPGRVGHWEFAFKAQTRTS